MVLPWKHSQNPNTSPGSSLYLHHLLTALAQGPPKWSPYVCPHLLRAHFPTRTHRAPRKMEVIACPSCARRSAEASHPHHWKTKALSMAWQGRARSDGRRLSTVISTAPPSSCSSSYMVRAIVLEQHITVCTSSGTAHMLFPTSRKLFPHFLQTSRGGFHQPLRLKQQRVSPFVLWRLL